MKTKSVVRANIAIVAAGTAAAALIGYAVGTDQGHGPTAPRTTAATTITDCGSKDVRCELSAVGRRLGPACHYTDSNNATCTIATNSGQTITVSGSADCTVSLMQRLAPQMFNIHCMDSVQRAALAAVS